MLWVGGSGGSIEESSRFLFETQQQATSRLERTSGFGQECRDSDRACTECVHSKHKRVETGIGAARQRVERVSERDVCAACLRT